jgi:hypothetical protein
MAAPPDWMLHPEARMLRDIRAVFRQIGRRIGIVMMVNAAVCNKLRPVRST